MTDDMKRFLRQLFEGGWADLEPVVIDAMIAVLDALVCAGDIVIGRP